MVISLNQRYASDAPFSFGRFILIRLPLRCGHLAQFQFIIEDEYALSKVEYVSLLKFQI